MTALLTLHILWGNIVYIQKYQVESFYRGECVDYHSTGNGGLFRSGYEIRRSECTYLTLKSRDEFKVTETPEQIKEMLEDKK